MIVDESTQTNGVPAKIEPQAGLLTQNESSKQPEWSVESALAEFGVTYAEHTASPIPFFHLLERLKTTKRAGWKRFGMENPESISDHMYRMSIIALMAPASISSKLDLAKCSRMALVHDMAESLVGDITPVDPVSKEEKSRRESETMDYIATKLLGKYNGGLNGQELRELWQEYEDSATPDSHFVHDVDKIELILQTVEYERSHECTRDLGEFTWVINKIQSDEVRKWAEHVLWERLELWQSYGREATWASDGSTKPRSKPASW